MPETFLTSTSHSHFTQASDLTPLQVQMDGLISTFVDKTTDLYSLAGVFVGGGTNRIVSGGIFGAVRPLGGLASKLFLPLSQVMAGGAGFVAEAALFSATPRVLQVFSRNGDLSLLHLHGTGGMITGAVHAGLSLASFKVAGVISPQQNWMAQGLLQSSAMMVSHRASALWGIADLSKEGFGQEWIEAQAMICQLWLGMRMLHCSVPGLAEWEGKKHLEIHAIHVGVGSPRPQWSGTETTGTFPLPQLAMGGNAPSGNVLGTDHAKATGARNGVGKPQKPIVPHVFAATHEGDGRSGGGEIPEGAFVITSSSGHESSSREEPIRISSPGDIISKIKEALGRENPTLIYEGSAWGDASIPFLAEKLSDRLPKGKVLTFILERRGQQIEFSWVGDKIEWKIEDTKPESSTKIPPTTAEVASPNTPEKPIALKEALPSSDAANPATPKPSSSDVPIATTTGELFAILQAKLGEGDVTVRFEGPTWPKEMTPSVEKWLGKGKDKLLPGKTATIVLEKLDQKVIFFWEEGEIKSKTEQLNRVQEEVATVAEASASPQGKTEEKTVPPPGSGSFPAPILPPTIQAKHLVVFASKPNELVAKGIEVVAESNGGDFDIVYTGVERPQPEDYERFSTQRLFFTRLNKGQRFRVHLTQFREQIEFVRRGETLDRDSRRWVEEPTHSSNTADDWPNLIGLLGYFLPPHRKEIRNPTLTHKGIDSIDRPVLDILTDILNDHFIAEGQTITLKAGKAGRGGGQLTIERKGDRITAQIQRPNEADQKFFLLSDPTTGRLNVAESLKGNSYPNKNLSEYKLASKDLILRALGNEKAGADAIQDPKLRGELLAKIANQALKDPQLTPYHLNQCLEVHRLIEQAYVHLDFEMIQSYQDHLDPTLSGRYKAALEHKGAVRYQLIPLEQMPLQLPGSSMVPRSDELRDFFLRHGMFEEGPRSPRETLVLLRDPERLGQFFIGSFNNRVAAVLSDISFIKEEFSKESLASLLSSDRDLPPEVLEIRNDILGQLKVLSEYRRILIEGSGSFHEAFLRAVLFSKSTIRNGYSRLHANLLELPEEARKQLGIGSWPSLEEIEARVQKSSPDSSTP
jgi:hypothetical protein